MRINHNFKKEFGQNFLRDSSWAVKMVEQLQVTPGEKVVEIGPGNGMVTNELLKAGALVYAIEIDKELIPILLTKFSSNPNFKLINSDILKIDFDSLGTENYKVVGSLPYNISKKIIAKFLTQKNQPQKMVFIIQKEVGQEYTAKAPKSSFLSNYVQLYSKCDYVCRIPNHEFYPTPKVDGSIIKFSDIKPADAHTVSTNTLLRYCFGQPRKKLLTTLSSFVKSKEKAATAIQSVSSNLNIRPAELSFDDWIKISNLI